jgi:hypothetical protein
LLFTKPTQLLVHTHTAAQLLHTPLLSRTALASPLLLAALVATKWSFSWWCSTAALE